MSNQKTRRNYLLTLSATGALGLAGCSQINDTESTAADVSTSNLSGANFSFEYDSQGQQVTIQYNGEASIVAGDLQVRSSAGLQVQWPQLGSTVAGPDDLLSTGTTAVLGEDILNWGEPVGRNETIRLVHVGREAPATLGRFTPPESSTLTSTVPPTDAPTDEPTEEPTETPTATPTEEPTATPTEEPTATPTETPTEEPDTTAPSITAFSISNPSGQKLRTSFDSDEQLATIQVSISGAEEATLTTSDFSETTSEGTYTFEATYDASSDGDYTATLDEASDESGNDGASGESVSLSVDTTDTSAAIDGFEDGNIDEYFGDMGGFEVQNSVVMNGEYSLKGQVQNGDNQNIYREVGFSQPSRVQGYVKVIQGGGNENAHISYLSGGSSGENVLHINFRMNEGSDHYGDESGDPQLDVNGTRVTENIEYDTWYFVELTSINWEDETVGEVLLDESVVAEGVDFQESATSVDTLQLTVNDWGSEIGYFDDVSVGQ